MPDRCCRAGRRPLRHPPGAARPPLPQPVSHRQQHHTQRSTRPASSQGPVTPCTQSSLSLGSTTPATRRADPADGVLLKTPLQCTGPALPELEDARPISPRLLPTLRPGPHVSLDPQPNPPVPPQCHRHSAAHWSRQKTAHSIPPLPVTASPPHGAPGHLQSQRQGHPHCPRGQLLPRPTTIAHMLLFGGWNQVCWHPHSPAASTHRSQRVAAEGGLDGLLTRSDSSPSSSSSPVPADSCSSSDSPSI